ncbi:MAG: hypothetical protein HKN87_08225 [Saprospiraceae bacterium]|nr:hypothetical protein [Saprospiraceae bacterium]
MWQLITNQYTLKWDAIDITLPWRYFVADSLRHGFLPLWNPFQHQGFAQGTIPETWYPIGILLGLCKGYGLYSLSIEYVLHLLIAAMGFYRLARTLGIDRTSALWGAMIFPLSGFFVGNAQHMGWIIAGAWMPHVFHTYLQFRRNWNWRFGAYFAMACFMLASGGYTAYCIVSAYIIVGAFIYDLVKQLRERTNIRPFLAQYARLLLLTVSACAVILVCLIMLKNDIYRGIGLSGEASLKGSLRLRHLLSLLFPYPSVKDTTGFWQGDQSLINMYIGLVGIILASFSLRSLRQAFVSRAWLLLSLFLLLALGHELPIRSWFNALPLFNLFRLPSLFRYFVVLILLLLAAKMLTNRKEEIARHLPKIALIGAICFFASSIVYALQDMPGIVQVFKGEIHNLDHAFAAQLLIHTCLFSLLYILLKSQAFKKNLIFALLFFGAVDMMVAVQLNGRVSIFSEDKVATIASCMAQLPQGYPQPHWDDFIGSNADQGLASSFLYRNTNTLYKRIGWNGYTPFQYKKYIEMEQSEFFNKNLGLPAIYISPYNHKPPGINYFTAEPDLHLTDKEIKINDFGPNHIRVATNAAAPRLLVYNQNMVHGWKGFIDNNLIQPVLVDIGLVGFLIPQGEHVLDIVFKPGYLINGLIISASILGLLLLAITIRCLRQCQVWQPLVMVGTIPISFIFYEPVQTMVSPPLVNQPTLLNSVDKTAEPSASELRTFARFLDKADLPNFKQSVANLTPPFTYLYRPMCAGQYGVFPAFLKSHFTTHDTLLPGGWKQIHCNSPMTHNLLFSTSNRFEGPARGWINSSFQIKSETNGNRYQDLTGGEYSSTFEEIVDTNSHIAYINIDIDVRTSETSNASLICSIMHGDTSIFWQSWQLAYQTEPHWSSRQWQVTVDRQVPAESRVGIYVWNPQKAELLIDNIDVQAARQ